MQVNSGFILIHTLLQKEKLTATRYDQITGYKLIISVDKCCHHVSLTKTEHLGLCMMDGKRQKHDDLSPPKKTVTQQRYIHESVTQKEH